jgi:hypothetical protein
VVSVTVTPPDLAVVVFESRPNGVPSFEARLQDRTGRLNWKRYGPVPLRFDPAAYFDDFFADIERLPIGTTTQVEAARRHLAAKGVALYEEVVPPDLRAELWSLRNQVSTVQIQSEEPWIPWELCRMTTNENGSIVEAGHLCEEFAVTRWLLEVPKQSTIALSHVAIVVPDDSNLPFASAEQAFMLSLAGPDRVVKAVEASAAEIRRQLASGEFDGWHFSGHGAFRKENPNRSAMILQSGEEFTPEDLSGVVSNLGRAKPVVFLNACQIGRGAMGLTGVGGWASKFLRAGASVFVGAHWSVYDKAASRFAETFYRSLLAGRSVAVATQEGRGSVKDLGDPSWLAYTVFAEPTARLTA